MRLFFMMGAPKSGTTWLQTIMNAHPEIACFGEGHFIELIVQPMQDVLRRYNQKLEIVGRAVYEGAPCYPIMTGQDVAALIRPMIQGLMRRAGPSASAQWWGDKTPAYSQQLQTLDMLFPHCRFIDIIRDPRDVALSTLHHARRAGVFGDFANDRDKRAEQIRFAARRWVMHARAIEQAKIDFGARMLQVRYQDLVTGPHAALRRLYDHLPGIAVNDAVIADIVTRCSFAAMTGRQPGEIDDSSFFRSGVAGRFAAELSGEEIELVNDLVMGQQAEGADLRRPAPAH